MSKPVYQFIIPLTMAASLAACGGSSNSEKAGQAGSNQSPVAADVSVTYDLADNAQQPINVLESASDPDGDALTLIAVGEPEYGTATIEDSAVVYQPEDGFIGVDTFSYTVSDGQAEVNAEVEVSVVSTVAFQGRVIDAPIANATVTITIGDDIYTTQADDDGFYELPATLAVTENDEIVRIVARGNEEHNQAHVTLSSLTTSVGQLLAIAGDDFTIDREKSNDVQVTHVSTARDVLVRRAARGAAVTANNVTNLSNEIEPQVMLEMAGVMKLVIDNPSFSLPDGYSDIESFLNSPESYASFVETASVGDDASPLSQAIEETVSDPDVMPLLGASSLLGDYLAASRSPSFLSPMTSNTWRFTNEGLAVTHGAESETSLGAQSFRVQGSKIVFDDQDADFSTSEFRTIAVGTSYIYDDEEAQDAWNALYDLTTGEYVNVTVTETLAIRGLRVVSTSASDMVVRATFERHYSPLSFSYEGNDYEVTTFDPVLYESDIRLVKVDSFMGSNISFDFENDPLWLLPPVTYLSPDAAPLHEFSTDGTYELLIQPELQSDELNSGTWSLSEDKRSVTLTSANEQFKARYTRVHSQDERQSVIVEYLKDGEFYAGHLGHGLPLPEQDLTPIDAVTDSSLLFNSMVNSRSANLWDANDQVLVQSFMFDFAADGTGEELQGKCVDYPYLAAYELCPTPMLLDDTYDRPMTWSVVEHEVLGQVFVFERNPGDTALSDQRYWYPVGVSERGIVSMLEWNTRDRNPADPDSGLEMLIAPRVNLYQYFDRDEFDKRAAAQ